MIYKITIDYKEDGIDYYEDSEIYADNDYELNYDCYLETIKEVLDKIEEISKEKIVYSYEAKVSLLGQDIVNNPYWICLHKSTFKFVKTR